MDYVNRNLSQNLSCYDLLLESRNLDCNLYSFLHWDLFLDIDVSNDLYFFESLLNHRHLNDLLHKFYYLANHFFLYDFLDKLRNFYHFLYHSWNNYDLLDYLFYLHHFRNLDHLLYNLLHKHWDFFNPVHDSGHLDNPFFVIFDSLRYVNIDIRELLYLDNSWLFDYQRFFHYHLFDVD